MLYKTEEILERQGITFQGEVPSLPALLHDLSSTSISFSAPLMANFDISIGSKDFLLLGSIRGKFCLHCSRCLAQYAQSFEQDIESIFPRQQEELDIGEEIRQAVVLAIPAKPICQLECRGLCPQCGVNRNIEVCQCQAPKANPFAKLKKLIEDQG